MQFFWFCSLKTGWHIFGFISCCYCFQNLPKHIKPLLRDPSWTSRTGGNSKRYVYAYRGVCRQARKGHDRWQAQISFNGFNHYLGTFDSEWDAAAIYGKPDACCLHPEFCNVLSSIILSQHGLIWFYMARRQLKKRNKKERRLQQRGNNCRRM